MTTLEKVLNLTKTDSFTYTDKLVLITLVHLGNGGHQLGNKNVARFSCCTVSTVIRATKNLAALGLVAKTHNRDENNNGEWLENSYTINEDALDALTGR